MTKHWTMLVAALLLLPAANLAAQERSAPERANQDQAAPEQTTQQRTAQQRGEQPRNSATNSAHNLSGHVQGTDRTIAECLAISNQEEIALAKMAVKHSENQQVKKFAETLIRDHQKFLGDLQRFGGEDVAMRAQSDHLAADHQSGQPRSGEAGQNTRASATERANEARRDAISTSPSAREGVAQAEHREVIESQRTAGRAHEGFNFLDVKRQVAEKCVQSAQKQWSEHRGNEADECYLGGQIVMHQQMIDSMEVLKKYASPDFQALLDQGISSSRDHLSQAKQLVKQVASADSKPSEANQPANN